MVAANMDGYMPEPGTAFGGTGTDAAGIDTRRIGTNVTPLDLKDCKMMAWDLTAVVNNNTLDTKLSQTNGGRIVSFAIVPTPSLSANLPGITTIATHASGSVGASLAISTGVVTFTVTGTAKSFTFVVWYK